MAGERFPTAVTSVYQPVNPLGGDGNSGKQNGIACGEPSLAATATTGFLWVPTVANTPTGVPIALTGYCPICIDITNHLLYVYEAGAWKSTALA
jgi:hypothetical protein